MKEKNLKIQDGNVIGFERSTFFFFFFFFSKMYLIISNQCINAIYCLCW